MALAAGCTIILKASELSPRTQHILAECFEEAGIPKGVIEVIQAKREDAATGGFPVVLAVQVTLLLTNLTVVEAVISHKDLRKVDFIGSAAVGRRIAATCAKYLKPILMELGGKGPAIVLDDANLETAANLCLLGGKCSSPADRRVRHSADFVKPWSVMVRPVSPLNGS